MGDGEHEYEFDIAVSFAGEDRDYVQEVVEGVKTAGHTVFYDDDHIAEMWGEDGVEYLSTVYKDRARYVVMFVSRHYAEKMWPRLERRSALARAVIERNAYVLPVRLDDTELPGLLPTTIYVDANRVGLSGLVELIKAKLIGASPTRPSSALIDGKVPRSQEAIEATIAERPEAWEYLLYAAMLRTGVDSLEDKYRDHVMEYAPRTGTYLDRHTIKEFAQAGMAEIQSIVDNFDLALSAAAQEAAFGKPGEPGDVDRILHMAQKFVSVYEDFLDWAANLRGASPQGEHARAALRLLASAANQPVESMRDFVSDFVSECDTMLERAHAGEDVQIIMNVVLELENGLMARYLEELRIAIEDE